MSNSTTLSPAPSSSLLPSSAILSPVRYDPTNFLPTVTSTHPPTTFEQPTIPNSPYHIPHRERIVTQHRHVINSADLSLDKDTPSTPNILPTVGPELLNNEVMIPNQQPVVSIVSEPTQEGDNSGALVPGSKTGQTYVDITEYLNMPQSEAAKKLGIPTSTLSKRWKEAVRGRKWPYRMICKLDKEIMTLLHNVPQGTNGTGVTPPFPEDIENTLTRLIRLRNEELKSVVIRI